MGGVLPSGTGTFAEGVSTHDNRAEHSGDTVVEPDETFAVTFASATNGTLTGNVSAVGTITNDDVALSDQDPSTTHRLSPINSPAQLATTPLQVSRATT